MTRTTLSPVVPFSALWSCGSENKIYSRCGHGSTLPSNSWVTLLWLLWGHILNSPLPCFWVDSFHTWCEFCLSTHEPFLGTGSLIHSRFLHRNTVFTLIKWTFPHVKAPCFTKLPSDWIDIFCYRCVWIWFMGTCSLVSATLRHV